MSDILVPIALSSQLDVTGEERLHAAKYVRQSRPSWVDPRIYFVYAGNENSVSYLKIGYAYFDDQTNNIVDVASREFTAFNIVENQFIEGDGEFFALVPYDNDAPINTQVSGLYSFRNDGTSTLAIGHQWQISGTQYHIYESLHRMSDGTFILMVYDEDVNKYKLQALSYTYAGGFVELGEFVFSNGVDRYMCLHNDYVIVVLSGAPSTMYAYSFNGTTFTLLDTYSPGISVTTPYSNGSQIITLGTTSYTFNGTTFGAGTSGLFAGCRSIAFDDAGFMYRATTADLKVYDTNFTQVGPTSTFATIHDAFLTIDVVEAVEFTHYTPGFEYTITFIPSGTGYAAGHGSIRSLAVDYSYLDDFGPDEFPFSTTPVYITIKHIASIGTA